MSGGQTGGDHLQRSCESGRGPLGPTELASLSYWNWRAFDPRPDVESVYAEGDGPVVGMMRAGGGREHDKAMVGGMERFLRKGSIHIAAAAGPNIDAALAVAAAAADNAEQDMRIPAGQHNLHRHTGSGSQRTAFKIKRGWGC